MDFEVELIRQTTLTPKFNHLSDVIKMQILKRNLYHLDGISSQTRLPHDTYFWAGSLCMVTGALLACLKYIQYQKRLFCLRCMIPKNSGGGDYCQMLSRSNCSVTKSRGYSQLTQDQIEHNDLKFNQIIIFKQYQRCKKELKLISILSGAFFAVGAGINVDHMRKSSDLSSTMLNKQWGVDELDHESTVRLLSILISRNLYLFNQRNLETVADYVADKTGEETYWDVPSTYLSYSPLVIMQFLFDELELNIMPQWPTMSKFLEEAFVHYSTVDETGTFWERTWIGKSYLEWSKSDYECRDFLLAQRNLEREEKDLYFAAKRLENEIDRMNQKNMK